MINIEEYEIVKDCDYKGEHYSVRDNGAVMRHSKKECKKRPLDGKWTFGKPDEKCYLKIGGVPVHRIVATAFHGAPKYEDMVVDHIDTNHQNNRPYNLRWLTRFENVMNNPVTVAKIIYRFGSVDEFWKDPSQLKTLQGDVNNSWMRPIKSTEIESRKQSSAKFINETNEGIRFDNKIERNKKDASPEEVKQKKEMLYQPRSEEELAAYTYSISELQWADDYRKSPYEEELRLEEEKRQQEQAQIEQEQSDERERLRQLSHEDRVRLGLAKPDVQSLNNPIAMQRDWTTPAKFYFCPTTIGEDPIREYASRIKIGKLFSEGIYDNYVVEYSVNTSGTFLVLKSHIVSSMEKYDASKDQHCYGVMEISVENGKYIHTVHRVQYYEDECDYLYNSVVDDCENE